MGTSRHAGRLRGPGFTLVELLVVLAIIGLLIAIVAPHYVGRLSRAQETVLRQDLAIMRDGLDKYRADQGIYPATLEDLVSKRYLRAIPPDPLTQSTQSWVTVPPPDPKAGAVFDIRSGAPGVGSDGKSYGEW